MNERFIQLLVVVAAVTATVTAVLLLLDRSDGGESLSPEAFSQTVVDSTVTQLLPEITKLGQELTKTVSGFFSLIADRVDDNRLRRRDIVSAFCEGKSTTQIVAAFGYERSKIEEILKKSTKEGEKVGECAP